MDLLSKTWDNLSSENQILLKKTFWAGVALYIVLLVKQVVQQSVCKQVIICAYHNAWEVLQLPHVRGAQDN